MFIRTPRLFLRPAWAEDARALYRAIACWDVVKNLGRAPWPYSMTDAEAFVAGKALEPDEASFLIFARTDGDPILVGSIGFGRWRSPDDEIELGYWIARDHWGRGYATEAGRAVIELAFEGLRLQALSAGHFVDNPASGAVLRKLGFRPTGSARPTPCRARGEDVMADTYTLARDERADRSPLAIAA
jgi:RimJ/RimL family protein N-acetyltransferase